MAQFTGQAKGDQLARRDRRGWLSAAAFRLLDQLVAGSDWVAFTYATNWSDWGAGEATGGYRMDATGRVWLKGLSKKSVALSASDTITTLPAGFRPATEHIFNARTATGTTELRVSPAGVVYTLGAPAGSNAWVSLAGFSFDPAT